MLIAIASQNKRTVSGHAEHCRNFFIYQIRANKISNSKVVELAEGETFQASGDDLPPALNGIGILICSGIGTGLFNRLKKQGITVIITDEPDPTEAIAKYLAGPLDGNPLHSHKHGDDQDSQGPDKKN